MSTCLIGLGSNLGDRGQTLDRAVKRLDGYANIDVTRQSGWYDTAAVGGPAGQGRFLNGAVLVETSLAAEAVLSVLRSIETELGRRRRERWGPRPIDLDLLLYDRLVLKTPELTLPHPRMAWRRFVLEPAAEVAGSWIHPTTGWTIARLLEHLNTAKPYVAIAGPIGAGKTRLAEELAQETSARLIADQVDAARLERFYADPSGNAWAVELEFLQQRARLLAADAPRWSDPGGLWVSDFWFDQCLAFAEVWLSDRQLNAFRLRWQEVRPHVVEPKLTVLLDVPTDQLSERIRRRGPGAERLLDVRQLQRIRRAIVARATSPGHGPLLRLENDDADQNLNEVLAAVEAINS